MQVKKSIVKKSGCSFAYREITNYSGRTQMKIDISNIEAVIIRRALTEYKQQLTACGDLTAQMTIDYIDCSMQQINQALHERATQ